jgi:hypothetical protein
MPWSFLPGRFLARYGGHVRDDVMSPTLMGLPRPDERFPRSPCLPRRPLRRVSSIAPAPPADGGITAFTSSGRTRGGSSASFASTTPPIRASSTPPMSGPSSTTEGVAGCALRVACFGLWVSGCTFPTRPSPLRFSASPSLRFPVSPLPRFPDSPFRRFPLQFSMPIASLHCVPPARAFA